MKRRKRMTITVFGNEIERKDSLAVKLVPKLKIIFPNMDFRISDPTESLEPLSDPWVILDVGEGIHEVTVIEDIHQLEHIRGDSVHDYDVYMELSLLHKLGRLPRIRLVVVPTDLEMSEALRQTKAVLRPIISVRK